MSRLPKPSLTTTYRVKTALKALAGKPLIDTIIPAESTIEWEKGGYAGGMASVFWLRRRVLVIEADLFTKCERLVGGSAQNLVYQNLL